MLFHLYRVPVWRCALATLVAVPASYFGVLFVTTRGHEVPDPVGAALFFLLCIVLALPLAVANAFAIAPYVVKTVRGRLPAVGSHLLLAAIWAVSISLGYLLLRLLGAIQLPGVWSCLAMLWDFAIFLGPAVIAGSLVYSLQYDSTERKLARCLFD